MQVAIRFRRESGGNYLMFSCINVIANFFANKIGIHGFVISISGIYRHMMIFWLLDNVQRILKYTGHSVIPITCFIIYTPGPLTIAASTRSSTDIFGGV